MHRWLIVMVAMTLWAVEGAPADPPDESKLHPTVVRMLDQAGTDERVKAWVLFDPRDKDFPNTRARESAVRGLAATYHPRAIRRRQQRRTRPGLFDVNDLPVSRRYLERIRATGAQVRITSKWVNGASVLATRAQLERIEKLPFVRVVQPVRRGRRIAEMGVGPATEPLPTPTVASVMAGFYGESETQLAQINLIATHTAGYTGQGVVIGILDTGFRRTHEAFNEAGHSINVIAEYDFVDMDSDTSKQTGDPASQHEHGTWILGVLGAYKPDDLVGAAYDASFILCKTEDTTAEYEAEEDNYVAGLEFIEANGGDLATASLGYIDWYTQADLDGLTAVTTIAVNTATANGLHCCNAAGNEDHDSDPATSSLIAPADAFDVLTCGAVDSAGTIASFSSDGPTADGRTKPELLAQGVNTRTVSAANNVTYTGVNGTSLSTPLVAGAVACLVQAHPAWTVERMRCNLLHTADYYVANQTFDPEYVLGYGIVDALAAATGSDVANDCELLDVPALSDGNLGVAGLILLAAGAIIASRRQGRTA